MSGIEKEPGWLTRLPWEEGHVFFVCADGHDRRVVAKFTSENGADGERHFRLLGERSTVDVYAVRREGDVAVPVAFADVAGYVADYSRVTMRCPAAGCRRSVARKGDRLAGELLALVAAGVREVHLEQMQ